MNKIQHLLFFLAAILCLTPYIQPPVALLLGLILAQTTGHPYLQWNQKATNLLLKTAVVGMGFGMNLHQAIHSGKEGFVWTICSIVLTLIVGWILGRWLNIESKTSYLISSGTAICGGSAIAAVSPIIKADEKQMSVALGVVFILNAVALFTFPAIGHLLNMSQHQFGLWCALAIHDTSSVVGASVKYGTEALQVATTIKLERALWIIPLSIFTALITKGESRKIKIPYFIGFFIAAIYIAYCFPEYQEVYSQAVWLAKRGLTFTLFLIGAGLSMKSIKSVGLKVFVQGIILWVCITIVSLLVILMSGNVH